MRVKDSQFVLSAPRYQLLPHPSPYPEIVLIGRSNVGKSSLINRLVGRTKLVRTSSTPGQTRLFNLFEVRYASHSKSKAIEKEAKIGLIDCPGYGFSKMSKKEQSERDTEFINLLEHRDSVQVVCLLNDCRRLPGPEELALRDFAFNAGKSVVVCLTKCDVLNRRESEKAFQAISNAYSLEKSDIVLTGTSLPPHAVWDALLALIE
jgi:GTP-binding protein